MPPHDDWDDDPHDSLDPEGPSAEDLARFDREGQTCPSCGSDISDLTSVCPVCGEILTSAPKGPARTYLWPLVAAVVLVIFLLTAVL